MSKDVLVLSGVEFNLRPLNFKALKAIQPHLGMLAQFKDAEGMPPPEVMVAVTEVVYLALIGGNPNTTQDQIDDLLTIQNFSEAIDKIFNVSEVVTSGEEKAVR